MDEVAEQESPAERSRGKLKIRLSQDEFAELRRSVSKSGFPNVASFAFQALSLGLDDDDITGLQKKRTQTLSINISQEFKEKIRRRAEMYQVTQQALVRSLLFQYIRNKHPQRTMPQSVRGS